MSAMDQAVASHLAASLVSDLSGKLSDDYDLWRARPFLGEVHEVVILAVQSFTQARDRPLRALDIGMGMGDGITELLLADTKLAVTGVDNEPKMIERARGRLAAEL